MSAPAKEAQSLEWDHRPVREHLTGTTRQFQPLQPGLELGPGLFNSFVGDWDSGTERSLSKLTDNTNLGAVVNTLPLQRDPDRAERWGHLNLMKFNNAKRKVLHLGEVNPEQQYRLGKEKIEGSPEKKDLGVLVEEKLNITCQHALGSPENQLHTRLHQKQHGWAAAQGRGLCTYALARPAVLHASLGSPA
ncbi:hypothetical protein DUI87_08971 [Hirundo rustica rustica]|uniref:Uncharacterized protein n=1 Tax=Hirundo rustica rustica TaxID=333673 RepID=A0A3M0KKV8_HIRRU|nr:hypothetical protein DUI87_08971 [Hirundo rustica rustica]